MKQLPTYAVGAKPLHEMMNGAITVRLLRAGLALKIFDVLTEARDADTVAGTLGTHAGNTRFFLDALVTIGLVEKDRARYWNSPLAASFLTTHSDTYLGPLFDMTWQMSVAPLDDLLTLVKDGPGKPAPGDSFDSEALWAEGARSGAGWALGEMGCRFARIVSKLPGFSGFQKMLDLGGGHGVFSLYMVDAHPTMRGTVFDRPAVVGVAEAFIRDYGFEDRVGVMAGDYITDDIGAGYDLIWASATLNFAKHDLDPLVAKIHAALNQGGYFVSLQDGMTREQTHPDTLLGCLAGLLTSGADYRLEQGAVAESTLRCGFRHVRSRTIDTPMGALELDTARK